MCDHGAGMSAKRNLRQRARWALALCGFLLASSAATAAPGDNVNVVRDLAGRVGPILGAALACPDIAQSRIQMVADKFRAVIRDVSSTEGERSDIAQQFDRHVIDGRGAISSGRTDCKSVDRQLADLERSISGPSLAAVIAPSAANAAPAPMASIMPPASTAAVPAPAPAQQTAAVTPTVTQAVPLAASNVRGINDKEIRFGIVAPFSGSARELGRQMKLGIDTAFNRVNDAGGVHGRMLRLLAADDGYEPTRTLDGMKQLYDKDQVFGFVGNVGTPTSAVAIPYALERRALFFGAFTGSDILRNDPPDRYVFNYRASYAEETDAVVHYLIKIKRLQPRQIAVFAQQDSYGDAGFAGVAKAFRSMGVSDSTILRLNYKRNTVDVEDAVNQLKAQKAPIRAIVMVATYRAAAKFIEKTRDASSRHDLHERLVRRQHRARRRVDAARPALCERRDRDPGGAGGRRLFERRARIQERARQVFSGRGGGLCLARGLYRRQCADPGHEQGRPAARHREADRHARGHAQHRSRPRHAA